MKDEWNVKNGKKVGSIIKEQYCTDGTNLNNILTKRLYKNNTSGIKGVYWDKTQNKWAAQITFQGKTHTLGRFDKKQEAERARKEAEKEYFGNYIENYKRNNPDGWKKIKKRKKRKSRL